MHTRQLWIAAIILLFLPCLSAANTTITYQGQLQDASGPFTGTPGMEFRLFDNLVDGTQVGDAIVLSAVPVTDGLFQVELDFGAPYGASPTFLEVMVAGQVLLPRQRISATPMAVHALSLDAAYADNRFWKLGGNAGTTPGTDIFGTTDNTPLEVHVAGARVLRLEPGDGPNVIAGSAANQVASGVVGASVAGGATGAGSNSVTDNFGTVGGGWNNQAGSDDGNVTSQRFATVGGGFRNAANGLVGTVGGGSQNTALGYSSTVGGGELSIASGIYATIAGGFYNSASAYGAFIGGGFDNTASGEYSTVGGGEGNRASGEYATVTGGLFNEAFGSYSWAAGRRANANHPGGFVWADSTDVDFASTGNDQFLVRASGGVGIGTNSPTRDLHIKQRSTTNSEIGLQIERSGASTNNWGFYIATSDNLGFRYNDTLMSRINASDGAYVALSDARAKHTVEPLTGVLDRVLQLRPRSYLMNTGAASQTRSTGLIAQEVQALFPDSVSMQEGVYGIKYSEITVLNTAALIEMNGRFSDAVANLERESEKHFAALKSENVDLGARVTELSAEKPAMRATADRNRALATIQALHDENQTLESRLGGLETELEVQSREVADLKAENADLRHMAQNNRELERRLTTLEALLIDQRLAHKEEP